ncbi:hypothetical protein AB0M95_25640 [Sphaerisporangium sp. NPDC051017]|uniref:hypothetical protein n=1 Tax=Sphaerisporangium sp. NPDC051017 TaxID=3154636 RepID=UPI003439A476
MDPGRTLAAGMAVVGAGFALMAFVSTTAGYAGAVAVWTLGEVVTAGMGGAVVAALAPPHLRGRYSGMFGFAWSVGGLLAPPAGTRLLALGHSVLWITVGAVGVLAAVGQFVISPAIRRRSAS